MSGVGVAFFSIARIIVRYVAQLGGLGFRYAIRASDRSRRKRCRNFIIAYSGGTASSVAGLFRRYRIISEVRKIFGDNVDSNDSVEHANLASISALSTQSNVI